MLVRSVKLTLKRLGIALASAIGPRLPGPFARRVFCDRIVPYLMDDAVLPRGLAERRTRAPRVTVLCDPYEYVHRTGYWCGVFFEEDVEAYFRRELRSGDSLIDVGMNVGHVALPAAHLVGASGRVVGFEPQPELARLVAELAERQGLAALRVYPCGLGDCERELELALDRRHLGGATFRDLGSDESPRFSSTVKCPVKVGDVALAHEPLLGRVALKIDAEGFELQVLRGLVGTLRARVDHAIIEISPSWLGDEGVTASFDLLAQAGLEARALEPDGRVGRALRPGDVRFQTNVVFRRFHPRLDSCIGANAHWAARARARA